MVRGYETYADSDFERAEEELEELPLASAFDFEMAWDTEVGREDLVTDVLADVLETVASAIFVVLAGCSPAYVAEIVAPAAAVEVAAVSA